MRNNKLKLISRLSGCMVFFIFFILVLVPFLSETGTAAPGDEVLAEKYAPILYFEKKETHFPVDAMYHIENSDLYEIGSDTPEIESPTAEQLKSYTTDGYYLDNKVGTIKSDVSLYSTADYDPTVYFKVHIVDGSTVIQYWMYYAFNNGDLNKHEGDWEMVQVVLENEKPSWVAYSQHHSGQWAKWDQVKTDGDHIKVYVARGAHANYLRSYSGKLGIASDTVGDNGKIFKPNDYTLVDLDDQDWLGFGGYWGEMGEGTAGAAASSSILGQAGPPGPQFREEGEMWNDPVGWGKGLPQANDMMFLAEWFFYNFFMIFIIITVIILALLIFFIYRRHKKYGLGPRIVSMLYIDGLNLKSIGNILCIVGIIIAIFGLFNTWYSVSYEFTGTGDLTTLNTEGWQDAILIDGLEGIQIVVPGTNGPTPVGTFVLPFSLLIGISLVFLIIATIGIAFSKKLGYKYIWRGIRLFTPIILIIIVLMALGSLVPSDMKGDEVEGADVNEIFDDISGSPFGNEKTYTFQYTEEDEVTGEDVEKTAPLNMKWGLGLGGIMLLLGGIIIIIGGVFEIVAKTQFFEPKVSAEKPKKEKKKAKKDKKAAKKQPVPPPAEPAPSKKEDETNFCPECGTKLEKDSDFCPECGTKKE